MRTNLVLLFMLIASADLIGCISTSGLNGEEVESLSSSAESTEPLAANEVPGLVSWFKTDAGLTAGMPVANFDATSGTYLSHADHAKFNPTGSFAWVGWLRADDTGVERAILGKYQETGDLRQYLLIRRADNTLEWRVSSDGTAGGVTSVNLSPNWSGWVFFEAWYDAGSNQIGLRINRDQAATASHLGGVPGRAVSLRIGASVEGAADEWDGAIGPLGLVHSLPTSAQLDGLYGGGSARIWPDLAADSKALFKTAGGLDGETWFDFAENGGTRRSASFSTKLSESAAMGLRAGPRDGLNNVTSYYNVAAFDESLNQSLQVNDNANFEISGDFAVCAWVRLSSAPANDMVIFSKYRTTGNRREYKLFYKYDVGGSRFAFSVSEDGTANVGKELTAEDTHVGVATLGQTYFVCGRYEGQEVMVEVTPAGAGARNAACAAPACTNPGSGTLIGAYNGAARIALGAHFTTSDSVRDFEWDGSIGPLFIAHSALGANLDALYNGGQPRLWADLSSGEKALFKKGAGTDGDLWFDLQEASGTRKSASGAISLSENNGPLYGIPGTLVNTSAGIAYGYVARWEDQSGNGNHLTADPGTEPRYIPGMWNQKPVLNFSNTGRLVGNGNISLESRYFTIVVVLQSTSAVQFAPVLSLHRSLAPDTHELNLFHRSNGSGSLRFFAFQTRHAGGISLSGEDGTVGTLLTNQTGIVVMRHGEKLAGWENGQIDPMGEIPTSTAYQPTAATPYLVLGNRFGTPTYKWAGRISEVLIYRWAVSDSERKGLESELAEKYGITLAQ